MKRVDVLLMEKGKTKSREQAQQYIKNNQVYADDKLVIKPSEKLDEGTALEIRGELQKYVSRGGYKLEGAINKLELDLEGKICIDVGASTGGFTDCMLQNGAVKVYAIDVGTSQLDEKLRHDDRVISIESTNINDIESRNFDKIDFIAIDVSFVSLTRIMEKVKELLKEDGELITLIKPQFEAGREFLNKKGIVKNEKVRKKVVENIRKYVTSLDMNVKDIIESPIKGGDGNVEYLMWCKMK